MERQAAVNIVDDGGWTALHWAVLRAPDHVVELLIGANVPLLPLCWHVEPSGWMKLPVYACLISFWN